MLMFLFIWNIVWGVWFVLALHVMICYVIVWLFSFELLKLVNLLTGFIYDCWISISAFSGIFLMGVIICGLSVFFFFSSLMGLFVWFEFSLELAILCTHTPTTNNQKKKNHKIHVKFWFIMEIWYQLMSLKSFERILSFLFFFMASAVHPIIRHD